MEGNKKEKQDPFCHIITRIIIPLFLVSPPGFHFPSFERFFHLRSEKMAAIPSTGSLIATHDYYRSESAYLHLQCSHFSERHKSSTTSPRIITKRKCLYVYSRASRVRLQQQLLWQRGVRGGGHSTSPRYE